MELDQNGRKVLRIVYNRGLVRGRDVKRFANLNPADLRKALDVLTRGKFVTIESGSLGVESEQAAMDSYVSVLPSRKNEVEYELAKADI